MAKQINVFTSPSRFKTINGQSIIGTGNISISGGGGSITVDSAIDATSTNPVQNKVIATALNNKQTALVSGTNIKTINETSVLGSGDITIPTTSLDGKTGAITFEDTDLGTTEFVVDSNNVFKRNIHIYQHNVSIINSSDKTYINIPFLATFAAPITTAATATSVLNAWLGESTNGEGIACTGVIKNGALDHQYVCLLKGQAAGTQSLKFVGMQSNGTTTDFTLAESAMANVVDKVLIVI